MWFRQSDSLHPPLTASLICHGILPGPACGFTIDWTCQGMVLSFGGNADINKTTTCVLISRCLDILLSHPCREANGPSVVRAMQVGSISRKDNCMCKIPSQNCFKIVVGLQVGTQVIHTNALLYLGAATCFYGRVACSNAQTKPILVEVIDQQLLLSGSIIEGPTPLHLIVGSHSKDISFGLISSPRHPIILGLSWLETQKPMVDWRIPSIVLKCGLTKLAGAWKPMVAGSLQAGHKTNGSLVVILKSSHNF